MLIKECAYDIQNVAVILSWLKKNSFGFIFVSHQGTAKDLLFPYLPKFAESFVQALSVADGDASDSGLKTEVIKVCYLSNKRGFLCHTSFRRPKDGSKWNVLNHICMIFNHRNVRKTFGIRHFV